MNATQFMPGTVVPFRQSFIHQFSTELQFQEEFILFFVLDGSIEVSIYSEPHTAQMHDIIFINSCEVFSVTHASPTAHIFALYMQPDYLDITCPNIRNITFSQHLVPYSESDFLYINLCSFMADIIFSTLELESVARLTCYSAGCNILNQLIQHFALNSSSKSAKPNQATAQISLLLRYLNTHYQEDISLSSAAQTLNFHPQYFSVFFKKNFQINFSKYLATLRINKSLPQLTSTNMSITEIAVSNGFSCHNTYSNTFRKLLGITPSEYRKLHLLKNDEQPSPLQIDYLSFFKKYQNKTAASSSPILDRSKHVTLDFSRNDLISDEQTSLPCIGYTIGSASLLLDSSVQTQIRETQKTFKINFIRINNIFSDNMFIYYENEFREITISWYYIDTVLDFLLSLDIKPFIELGYTPKALSSKNQYPRTLLPPNVSIPKSLTKWSDLISSFFRHLIDRYGLQEVLSWNFDFWTIPDILAPHGYWNDSLEKFFFFYRVTYHAIKRVNKNLRFGSPAFALPDGLKRYQAFFNYCAEHDMQPSYISSYLFDSISNTFFSISSDTEMFSLEKENQTTFSENATISNLTNLQALLKENHLDHLDIVVSTWNLSYLPKAHLRDTCFMSPYILRTIVHSRNHVSTLVFHTLSDVTEERFIDHTPFHGSPGILSFQGFKKSSFHAFAFLQKMGNTFISSGDNYLLTKSLSGFQLLLFNYTPYHPQQFEHESSHLSNLFDPYHPQTLNIHSLLPLPGGTYQITETRSNHIYGSSYNLWKKLNSPATLSPDMFTYLDQRTHPEVSIFSAVSNGALLLDTVLMPHEIVLLEIDTAEQS